jgi:hypothetical protein
MVIQLARWFVYCLILMYDSHCGEAFVTEEPNYYSVDLGQCVMYHTFN